jgi:WD40 repeat protein
MNGPEPTDPSASPLAERLLEYDAALAAGDRPARTVTDELPDDIQEGLSCLEMLERLRLSDRLADVFTPPPADSALDHSRPNGSTTQFGPRASDDSSIPAQLGRFRIVKVIGQGGCGVVFLADDPVLQRPVAIKVPRPEALLTPELRQRFLREGRAAACLDHPHVVRVFEAGEVGAICYLASEYCPGINLRDWLRHHGGPVPPAAAANLVATLAGAMHFAHQNGVLHRDLKPGNILLLNLSCDLQSAIPKIIDFGLAKVLRDHCGETGTRTGAVFGTPHYMAPEQAQGQTRAIGPATDIHALGVILYELLTGQLPYQGDTDFEVLGKVVAALPGSLSRRGRQVPRDLETICLKCLEKQPAHRYGSMRELGEDLHRFLDGRPICARQAGWAARVAKGARRRPGATAAAAMTGVLLGSMLAGLFWIRGRESARNAGMTRALREIGLQKAQAENQAWLARNQQYSAQIRSAALLKNRGQLAKLSNVLLGEIPEAGQRDVRGFEWQYLWRFGHSFLVPEPASAVTAVTYSQGGALVASGSRDGTIHVFERNTGKVRAKLRGHTYEVRTLDFLKNNTQLLSTAFDMTPDRAGFRAELILWSLGGEARILLRRADTSLSYGNSPFAPARFAPIVFIVDRGSRPHRVLTLDLETGTEHELVRLDDVHSVASTPDAQRLVVVHKEAPSSSAPFWVDLLETATRERIANTVVDKGVNRVRFSPDGESLALSVVGPGQSHSVEIRDVPSLHLRKAIGFPILPYEFAYDWTGKRLAILPDENRIDLWQVGSGQCLGSHRGIGALRLAFSPDGEEIVLGFPDGRVRAGKQVFEQEDQSLRGPAPKSEAWCVAFSPSGDTLAAGYDHTRRQEHETVRLWDLTTRKAKPLASPEETVIGLAISPDGKTMASAGYDRIVRLWDMAAGTCLHELKGHTETVRAVAFRPGGLCLASAGCDRSIKMWNVRDGSLLHSWAGHTDTIRTLAFAPDGKWLISGANDHTIKVWNADDGALVGTIAGEEQVQSIACSPDGLLLAAGNTGNDVELWQLASRAPWKTLRGHTGRVRSVAFSPDGQTLASGGEDKTVRLWNVASGQELLVFPTEHMINGLAFHPREPILAAALHDGTVKLWSGE